MRPRVFKVGVGGAVGFLGFERLHEAFGVGVVIRAYSLEAYWTPRSE